MTQMQPQKQSPDSSAETPPPWKNAVQIIQWIVLLVLVIWSLNTLLPTGSGPIVELPYSTFLEQIRTGNVKEVNIDGSQIKGSLNQAILWPPTPTPTATVAASQPTAVATPATALPGLAASAVQTTSVPYSDFTTNFPTDVGDPNLLPLLESHNVLVTVSAPSTPWLGILLTSGLPFLLLLLYFGFMGRQMMKQQSNIFNFGNSNARQKAVSHYPDVTFNDVAGADEAKADLHEIIDFLRNPGHYRELGARMPRGVLLVGPPGTGKTLLARAVAGEAGVPFFNLSGSEFVEMFVGVGASRVRDLFRQAKEAGSAIIFIDELDAVGRRRGAGLGNTNDEREQTLNQLLVEMDGFDEHLEIVVLAATNRPDVLDPALLRPGRFDRQVVVALPDMRGRTEILRIHSKQLQLADDVDLTKLAQATVGMSGADLANLCNEAALGAARQRHHQVMMGDFEAAIDKVVLGSERPLVMSKEARRVVAYHEAGHAVVAWLLPSADPVHKVTIIPHGRALGVTEQLPTEEQYNYSRAYLETRLAVMLGGRTAEEIAIGDITTGAENDLVEATRLARRMVTRWGMSEVGLAAFDSDDTQPFLGYELAQGRAYSETTAARIDGMVQQFLCERHQQVTNLLTKQRTLLDALAEELLAHETVLQPKLIEILGERPCNESPHRVIA
ncbi:MAG: ATP-dependent zinc metalloprotease FtsH [Caldilineaceae bacterium]